MKKECKTLIDEFKYQLQEVRIMAEQLDEMSLSEEDEEIWSLSIEESKRFRLFKEIRMLEHFSRKKNQWICKEFCDKLFELFEQYPTEHATIRRALKISYSTYFRLIKEFKGEDYDQRAKRRYERSMKALSKTDKNLVWLIVRPPTNPLTLNEI